MEVHCSSADKGKRGIDVARTFPGLKLQAGTGAWGKQQPTSNRNPVTGHSPLRASWSSFPLLCTHDVRPTSGRASASILTHLDPAQPLSPAQPPLTTSSPAPNTPTMGEFRLSASLRGHEADVRSQCPLNFGEAANTRRSALSYSLLRAPSSPARATPRSASGSSPPTPHPRTAVPSRLPTLATSSTLLP